MSQKIKNRKKTIKFVFKKSSIWLKFFKLKETDPENKSVESKILP